MSEEKRYFVYIMTNPSKTLYNGMTNSLRRRVREHKLKLTPGFAAKYNITRLVYFETFEDVRNAIEREKQIKAWTRAKRVALIESTKSEVGRPVPRVGSTPDLPVCPQDGVVSQSL
jgi:putative endonuclease